MGVVTPKIVHYSIVPRRSEINLRCNPKSPDVKAPDWKALNRITQIHIDVYMYDMALYTVYSKYFKGRISAGSGNTRLSQF